MAVIAVPIEEVTAEEVAAYEAVRESGQTNMFHMVAVQNLALEQEGVFLSFEVQAAIWKHYAELKEKFL